jgi:cytochrome c biogenesis protein CcdA
MVSLTIPSIILLALGDSINPCELAILFLTLIAILTQYPKEKEKALKAGLLFSLAVFLMYMIFGIFLVYVFSLVTQIKVISLILYKIIGVAGLALGISNLVDFFKKDKVQIKPRKTPFKKMLSQVTSLKGAFIIGIICALFLTPCTIGPYVIASGILNPLGFLNSLPWLFLYNFIFILPLIILTLIAYYSFDTVEKIYGWREKNIKILQIIAGIILIVIGIMLIFGLI